MSSAHIIVSYAPLEEKDNILYSYYSQVFLCFLVTLFLKDLRNVQGEEHYHEVEEDEFQDDEQEECGGDGVIL